MLFLQYVVATTWIFRKINHGKQYGNIIVFNSAEIQINVFYVKRIKGAPKWHFKYYSFAVIILFNAGLCQFAFFPYSFRKLVLHLSVFSVFSVCVSNLMRSLRLQCLEFVKLRAFRAYVPYVPMRLTCLRAFVPHITTCLRALNYYVPTCPRVCVPTFPYFSLAYV